MSRFINAERGHVRKGPRSIAINVWKIRYIYITVIYKYKYNNCERKHTIKISR